jgi:hypothetical protein
MSHLKQGPSNFGYIKKNKKWGGMQSTPRPFVKVVEASQMVQKHGMPLGLVDG